MSEKSQQIVSPAPWGEPDAAGRQQSSFASVSAADLVVIRYALAHAPYDMVHATLNRIQAEIGERHRETVDAAFEANVYAYQKRLAEYRAAETEES